MAGERCRNEVMREDAVEDKSDVGPRNPLMQTYVDDPSQENAAATVTTSSTAGCDGDGGGGAGSGMPQVA